MTFSNLRRPDSFNVVRVGVADGYDQRVAGTGTAGTSGDECLATGTQLNEPTGLAATADGGFLVTDTRNDIVRAVSTA